MSKITEVQKNYTRENYHFYSIQNKRQENLAEDATLK